MRSRYCSCSRLWNYTTYRQFCWLSRSVEGDNVDFIPFFSVCSPNIWAGACKNSPFWASVAESEERWKERRGRRRRSHARALSSIRCGARRCGNRERRKDRATEASEEVWNRFTLLLEESLGIKCCVSIFRKQFSTFKLYCNLGFSLVSPSLLGYWENVSNSANDV